MAKKNENTYLLVTALGGLHENGKNLYLFETSDKQILIVDAGILYPGAESPGVDYIFPEYQSLINKVNQIQALVLTSALESHCGGAQHLITKCNIKKVIGSKLALNLVKNRLSPDLANSIEWIDFESRKQVAAGVFQVTPVLMTSSSSESYACLVEAAGARVFYSGAFKLDQSPTDGKKTDLLALTQIGSAAVLEGKQIDLYLGDSTNAEKEGYSKSELETIPKLRALFASHKSRIIINTYNSNTIRIQNILALAASLGRKVALMNKAARESFKAAVDAGCIVYEPENIISIKEIDNYKDNEVLILSTAPEGEAIRELEDIAFDRSLEIQVKKGDMVINSADLPPGTVRIMAKIADEFFLKEVKIVGGRDAGVHVDNHAMSEELKFMFNLIRPKYFVPAMGETRQMIRHASLAVESGLDPGAIFILDNGDQIKIANNDLEIIGHIETSNILFNDSQDFHVDNKIVKERESLAKEGVVTVAFSVNKKKKVVSGPVFSAKACTFSNNKEWRAFCLMNSQDIIHAIENYGEDNPRANIEDFQNIVRDHMNGIIKNQIGKKPSVIVLASEV